MSAPAPSAAAATSTPVADSAPALSLAAELADVKQELKDIKGKIEAAEKIHGAQWDHPQLTALQAQQTALQAQQTALQAQQTALQEEKNLLLKAQQSAGFAASSSAVWVHSTVIPPGNKKSVSTFACKLAELKMDALLTYAQGVFEFPDGKFTITPTMAIGKKKGRGGAARPAAAAASAAASAAAPAVESKEDMEEEVLLIDSDDQLLHYLSTLPVDNKQAIHFRFAVVLEQKQFSDWKWEQIAKSLKLSDNPDMHTKANPLPIQPMVVTPRLTRIVEHFVERLRAERTVLPPLKVSKEAVASEYVSAVLTAVCLYLLPEHRITKTPQQDLSGTYGRGPIDFVLEVSEVMVCVTEVKRYGNFEQGLAQNIAQLEAALGQAKKTRKRKAEEDLSPDSSFSIGIVSDAVCWHVLQMSTEADGETLVRMAELPSLPLNDACDRPTCLSEDAAPAALAPAAAPATSSVAGVAAAAAASTPDSLRAHLEQLLIHLLPPIQECIEQRAQAAKRRKADPPASE